ncbi:putative polyprotein [Senna tora]|uniref:Putative polyprotein n=1 Tax=Senna tora TaxID=362788 RepID=A0A834X1Q5_9FABA|nr:putative polyprotein [Senna tora]
MVQHEIGPSGFDKADVVQLDLERGKGLRVKKKPAWANDYVKHSSDLWRAELFSFHLNKRTIFINWCFHRLCISMAEGTRFSKMDEALRALREDAAEFKRTSLAVQATTDQRLILMESTMKNMEAILSILEVAESSSSNVSGGSSAGNRIAQVDGHEQPLMRGMKVEIPHFDGFGAEDLIFKIQEFFRIYNTPMEQRISIASLHMKSVAYNWYKWMNQNGKLKSWSGFLDALGVRFGTSLFDDPKAALKDVRQNGSVEEYQARFEELSTKVHDIPEPWLITPKPIPLASIPAPNSKIPTPSPQITGHTTPPFKKLTAAEIKAKREQGLCYYCDAKYSATHKCPAQCFLLLSQEELEELQMPSTPKIVQLDEEDCVVVNPEISLNALIGQRGASTIKLSGRCNNTWVNILVDGGEVKLMVHGHLFVVDLFVIDLQGVDVVLGGRWMRTLGPIVMDYDKLTLDFLLNGHPVHLQGEVKYDLEPLSSKQLQHMNYAGSIACLFHLQAMPCEDTSSSFSVPPVLAPILTEFQQLFDEPQGLPPVREDDHRIYLPEGTSPVNVRPYRYPFYQKSEIEKLVAEMLQSGIYALIAQPLTALLKKDSFVWSEKAQRAFDRLKQCMVTAPVLTIPDFEKQFVVETDASTTGIGAILSQDKHPIPFFTKWRHYLLGREFVIITDHRSLKHLMEQAIQTPKQEHYLRKLLGFRYVIVYRPGKMNAAADALSRVEFCNLSNNGCSSVACDIWQEIQQENFSSPILVKLHQDVTQGIASANFQVMDGVLWFQNRVYLAADSALIPRLLVEHHASPMGGHGGMSPYEALYGRPPPSLLSYVLGSSYVHLADHWLQERDRLKQVLLTNLSDAQLKMKANADEKRRDQCFQVEEWVWVKLHKYKQLFLAARLNFKLSKKYYGPYKVVARIGAVAYHLDLPSTSKIHHFFHISLLKAFVGDPTMVTIADTLPVPDKGDLSPYGILDSRMVDVAGMTKRQVLVEWTPGHCDEAS